MKKLYIILDCFFKHILKIFIFIIILLFVRAKTTVISETSLPLWISQ